MLNFILGFVAGVVLSGLIAGVGLWLLTLIVSAVTFSWMFVFVIAGIFGVVGGIGTVSD